MAYYISIAFRWEQSDALEDLIEANRSNIAEGHVEVKRESKHCSLFAVAKINSESPEALRMIRELFAKIPVFEVSEILKKHLKGKSLTPSQWRRFPDNTTIQFETDADLTAMRKELRALLGEALELNYSEPRPPEIESLLCDKSKSTGDALFGSVARKRGSSDYDLHGWGNIPFKKAEITVSNDDLTNPREESDYRVVIIE